MLNYLESGRQTLSQAHAAYGRALSGEEYWWLGVGLAAIALAELNDRPYAVGRIEQLIDRLGREGAGGDWLQRLVEELAEMDAEGLLWPMYQRTDGDGPVTATGLTVQAGFDAEAGYFLALAHIGVALSVTREDQEAVAALASVIAGLVETGLTKEYEAIILGVLRPRDAGA